MFKFSFPHPEGGDDDNNKGESDPLNVSDVQWLSSEKVAVLPSHLNHMLSCQGSVSQMKIHEFCLSHLTTESAVKSAIEKSVGASSIKLAEELHSDLVPAKYEGGMKIWECTVDLLEWISLASSNIYLDGKNTLDLGCGAGLLGIAALKLGSNVIFQDYNKEVLDLYTIPNVLLNISDEECQSLIDNNAKNNSQCEFYSGDWSSFIENFQEGRDKTLKFDYILTSETIYNTENYSKLLSVFKKCLKTSGCVYLAAKTYYFGVGGGLRQFESVMQDDGILKSEVCWRCPSGVSREILKITFVS